MRALGTAAAACLVLLFAATGSRATSAPPPVTSRVGPFRAVTATFGYLVAYRSTTSGGRVRTSGGLFVYDRGRWSDRTPPGARRMNIEAVDFVDERHAWIAAFDFANVTVHVFRTSDGGVRWRHLGAPATHSGGGGPSYLSFSDLRHGWLEPVSPNGPSGDMLRTGDGGRRWRRLPAELGSPSLPCLAPIEFVAATTGWMARCGWTGNRRRRPQVFVTRDAGRTWRGAAVPVPDPRAAHSIDLPRFFGVHGVVAATGGHRFVSFATTDDGGRTWSVRAVRRTASCTAQLKPLYYAAFPAWPAVIASSPTWWIVAGRHTVQVQVTTDAGAHWRVVTAHGLPSRLCPVLEVSAVSATHAWAVARTGRGYDTGLYVTRDGGSHWRRVDPTR